MASHIVTCLKLLCAGNTYIPSLRSWTRNARGPIVRKEMRFAALNSRHEQCDSPRTGSLSSRIQFCDRFTTYPSVGK